MIPACSAPLLATALLTLGQAPSATAADLSPQYVQRSTRCPVCGMYPYRTPQWMAQIVFNDQTASTFDSPVDMFRFLNNMVVFDKQHKLPTWAPSGSPTTAPRPGWMQRRPSTSSARRPSAQ
jgi:hypothetical protein